VCGNCQRLNLQCKPSEFIAPSDWSTAHGSNLATTSGVDAVAPLPTMLPPKASALQTPPASTWAVYKSHLENLGLVLDDSLPLQNLQYSTVPSPGPGPDKPLPTGTVSLTPETAFLLQTFQKLARWMVG
jgi:hypothetical protein